MKVKDLISFSFTETRILAYSWNLLWSIKMDTETRGGCFVGLGLGCLTQLSTIFQLYHGSGCLVDIGGIVDHHRLRFLLIWNPGKQFPMLKSFLIYNVVIWILKYLMDIQRERPFNYHLSPPPFSKFNVCQCILFYGQIPNVPVVPLVDYIMGNLKTRIYCFGVLFY